MSCNLPVTAYYADKVNPETGKRSLTFNQRNAYKGSDPTIPRVLAVPCGKCHGCRADQSLMWAIRGYHEASLHQQNSFLTLTYNDENLPADGKIDKRHLQLFFKSLRRDGTKIRYIACGEYGGQTRRPHYHAIIFGKDWLEGSLTVTESLYMHPAIDKAWGKGFVSLAPVTMASICYVCGYVNKKMDDKDTFNLMSRRPGIGHKWLEKYGDDIVRTGVVSIEGQTYQVPKRYLMWDEESFEDLRKERAKYARAQNNPTQSMHNFYDQKAREENLRANRQTKKLGGKI